LPGIARFRPCAARAWHGGQNQSARPDYGAAGAKGALKPGLPGAAPKPGDFIARRPPADETAPVAALISKFISALLRR
jgi:hypothetical protein